MSNSKTTTQGHSHFAGRCPAGIEYPVVIKKNGVKHIRRLPTGEHKEILSVGLACSECFSGPRLARLLQAGFEYERKAIESLLSDEFASPLSTHTSGGVSEALSTFIEALEPHLPWKNASELDWCVSLQLEGASAVWAAIDMVLQLENTNRKIVAVGSTSYHGPPSTSLGSKSPLWEKTHQVTYPVPIAGESVDESLYISKFQNFLDQYQDEVGVLLIEPQWGSSQAAFPWPDNLLKTYVAMAKGRGIRIVCDEIMCGLGRHGKGTLFVSEALDLDPDVITFGKAIGGGVFPFAGAILRNGRDALCSVGRTVMQSHTYAAASVRALMTATEVLKEIPVWLPSIQQNGQEMSYIFRYLRMIADGMLITHGQGLMWGAIFSKEGKMKEAGYRSLVVKCFHRHCEEVGILPYIVPCGGFMVTPVVDIDVGTIYEIGQKLEEAILRTIKEIKWKTQAGTRSLHCHTALDKEPLYIGTCQDYLHATKSCTSCSTFVSSSVRMRFVE